MLLDVYLEAEVDFGRGHAAANSPVLRRTLAQQRLDVIGRDAKVPKLRHDCTVERFLCLERTSGEQVDIDQRVSLVFVRRAGEAMRLVDNETNRSVPLGSLDAFHERSMDGFDDGCLLLLRVAPAN